MIRKNYILPRSALGLLGLTSMAGCDGAQSALAPAGRAAVQIANLFWVMLAGAVVIWLVVIGLATYAKFINRKPHDSWRAKYLIIGGGVVIPTIVLFALLSYGLAMLPDLLAPAPAGSLRIQVSGLQWWWRVRYAGEDDRFAELANEIRLPVGEPVEFELGSADVIHSFWIPSLGGKMDMIPGRQNRLRLEPLRTGVFRGVCAEYCGASHALMSFYVVVMEPDDFAAWLATQQQPAQAPASPLAERGEILFQQLGCGACHSIRGTDAAGGVGPDLTHVGGRLSLAAGLVKNDREHLQQWIRQPKQMKPEALMPAFDMLPPGDLEALSAYLEGLK